MWVALDADRVVGMRVFLRWRFLDQLGRTHPAVRAVDTATRPSHQGRGIFSRLTSSALDELAAEGVELVFNTPNDQSRPGYLKLGWKVLGRVPIGVRPRGIVGVVHMAGARAPAAKWSEPPGAGVAIDEALADPAVVDLLARCRSSSVPSPESSPSLRTDLTADHLSWRYRFEPLAYRALPAPTGVDTGLAVYRVRRRGRAREAVLCDALVPGGDADGVRALVGAVARATRADYVLAADRPGLGHGTVPVPRLGPVLTWRAVTADAPPVPLAGWRLTMGDVELF